MEREKKFCHPGTCGAYKQRANKEKNGSRCGPSNCPKKSGVDMTRNFGSPIANSTQILFIEPNFSETPSEYDVFYDCFSDYEMPKESAVMPVKQIPSVISSMPNSRNFREALKQVIVTAQTLLVDFDNAVRKDRKNGVQTRTIQLEVSARVATGPNGPPPSVLIEPVTFTIPLKLNMQGIAASSSGHGSIQPSRERLSPLMGPSHSKQHANNMPAATCGTPMEPIRTSIIAPRPELCNMLGANTSPEPFEFYMRRDLPRKGHGEPCVTCSKTSVPFSGSRTMPDAVSTTIKRELSKADASSKILQPTSCKVCSKVHISQSAPLLPTLPKATVASCASRNQQADVPPCGSCGGAAISTSKIAVQPSELGKVCGRDASSAVCGGSQKKLVKPSTSSIESSMLCGKCAFPSICCRNQKKSAKPATIHAEPSIVCESDEPAAICGGDQQTCVVDVSAPSAKGPCGICKIGGQSPPCQLCVGKATEQGTCVICVKGPSDGVSKMTIPETSNGVCGRGVQPSCALKLSQSEVLTTPCGPPAKEKATCGVHASKSETTGPCGVCNEKLLEEPQASKVKLAVCGGQTKPPCSICGKAPDQKGPCDVCRQKAQPSGVCGSKPEEGICGICKKGGQPTSKTQLPPPPEEGPCGICKKEGQQSCKTQLPPPPEEGPCGICKKEGPSTSTAQPEKKPPCTICTVCGGIKPQPKPACGTVACAICKKTPLPEKYCAACSQKPEILGSCRKAEPTNASCNVCQKAVQPMVRGPCGKCSTGGQPEQASIRGPCGVCSKPVPPTPKPPPCGKCGKGEPRRPPCSVCMKPGPPRTPCGICEDPGKPKYYMALPQHKDIKICSPCRFTPSPLIDEEGHVFCPFNCGCCLCPWRRRATESQEDQLKHQKIKVCKCRDKGSIFKDFDKDGGKCSNTSYFDVCPCREKAEAKYLEMFGEEMWDKNDRLQERVRGVRVSLDDVVEIIPQKRH